MVAKRAAAKAFYIYRSGTGSYVEVRRRSDGTCDVTFCYPDFKKITGVALRRGETKRFKLVGAQ